LGRGTEAVTSAPFHYSKRVAEIEWWLEWAALPARLTWGRLRVFDDGTADVSFGPEGCIYGFENRIYAGYFLSEDEFSPLAEMDEEDEAEYGIVLGELKPPTWEDNGNQRFEYLGTY
jgi:hypothetical protein